MTAMSRKRSHAGPTDIQGTRHLVGKEANWRRVEGVERPKRRSRPDGLRGDPQAPNFFGPASMDMGAALPPQTKPGGLEIAAVRRSDNRTWGNVPSRAMRLKTTTSCTATLRRRWDEKEQRRGRCD